MPKIDVCLVAARRPDLLERTLQSFHGSLFANFDIGRIVANIDPVFGSLEDERECVRLIRHYDPDALVRTPAQAGFAAAVAWVWSSGSTDVILHIEDDWLLRRPVFPADIRPFDDAVVGQISFNHANKNWDISRKGHDCYLNRRVSIGGVELPIKRKVPLFLTCPSFFRGSFARRASELMDPNYDPEKQFCRGVNPRLEAFVRPFRNRILGHPPDYYIEDIGRQWRVQRKIEKQIVDWQSVWDWTPEEPAAVGRPEDFPAAATE